MPIRRAQIWGIHKTAQFSGQFRIGNTIEPSSVRACLTYNWAISSKWSNEKSSTNLSAIYKKHERNSRAHHFYAQFREEIRSCFANSELPDKNAALTKYESVNLFLRTIGAFHAHRFKFESRWKPLKTAQTPGSAELLRTEEHTCSMQITYSVIVG